MYLFNQINEYFDPFYQIQIQVFPWEMELIQTSAVRRLKFLSHYGTGSFITSAKHSRFEHTIGVWTIVSTFFPKDEELRIASLLHDIGHLPFSHAVENTLGFNHHTITEERIYGNEVSTILKKYGFSPDRIIEILNIDSPLSHKTPFLSADHLDSFLRDSYMLGGASIHPASILKRIRFNGNFVEADLATSKSILSAIHYDHITFLHPLTLALDALLSKAIAIFAKNQRVGLQFIVPLTNNELLDLLLSSGIEEVRKIMSIIMCYPEKVVIHSGDFEGAEKVEVRKVYDKTPLVDGKALISICQESRELIDNICSLKKCYYYSYS
ncbi:HD domain-containing protein [Bacillus sp. 3255]|uniref:HD domain-containing protein n=1 Tax=Bacillus sp. 3255 TaxID=2817904 RepID=UPI0028552C04|nr:HD domain-containing protein [Bacillus sp. 3255]MDR6884619.1 HD superfamily phosphohydrolase [Bacillus sp. 3255]